MGEAKRRGTFEERKAAAIERDGITREERERLRVEKLAAMTNEERQRRRAASVALAQLVGVSQAAGSLPYITHDSWR